jgi:hypothetical protein
LLEGTATVRSFDEIGMDPIDLESVPAGTTLTMRLAGGEIERYVTPGYMTLDGAHVGYNVVLPPPPPRRPASDRERLPLRRVLTEVGPAR